ncbi:MAG: SBBP repeat-containing protein, partial [Bacteroidetes bacterium]|nr:SBBP repeat-containing protein [Bacteroidota bacterium]
MVSITTIHVQIRIGFAAWIFLILFLQSYTIRSQNLMWVKQLGGTASDEGRAICVDDSGNILVTGAFEQNVDFDPGPAILEFNAPSSNGAFITKFDQTGQLLWAVPLVGNVSNTNNYGLDIATDRSGNVYVSGFFTNTVDFDPGPAEFNLTASARDVYVLKLDSYGHFVWAKQFGGISENYGYGIAVDGSQQVYVTGYFQYTVDFDPGANTHYLTPAPGIGGDIFVVKLDAISNFIWAEQLGGAGIDQGNDIAVDKNGNIYLTGTFQNTVDFDPGNGTYLLSSLDFDGFVCKLGANGSFIWARQFGGLNSDEGRSICVDAGGNVFVAGDFHGNGSFGSSLIISAGNSDAFVMKMDPNGNLVWINQYGSSGDDFANGVTERDGVIIVGGGFQGAIDFDTSPNTYNLTGPGAFVTKMSSDGRFLWADKLGSMVYSVGITSMYESVASGYFWNSVDFDPGGSDLTLTSAGYSDIFIWKGSSCATSSGDTTPIVACDSFKWINGVNYSDSNNTAIFNVGARNGCDSLVRLHLTVLKSTSSIQAITSCGSYKWVDNVTYTSSTSTPFITLKNKAGCDSLVHLNLKINGPTYSTQIMEACSSYKWIDGVTYTASTNTPYVTLVNKSGCDSTVNLNLKIRFPSSSTQNIEACSSFKWIDGVTYTTSTSAPFITLANKDGCDSIVHLNLKIRLPSSST